MPRVVPEGWKPHRQRYLRENRDRLSAGDFRSDQSVIIRFPDGSHVLFRYAFAIRDKVGGGTGIEVGASVDSVFRLATSPKETRP